MPGDHGIPNRLKALLTDLLDEHVPDPARALRELARALTPADQGVVLRRVGGRVRSASGLSTDGAVRAICVMHSSGVPVPRIVRFLADNLHGPLSLAQFELAVRFIFDNDPPLPQELVFDLTQYTYLESALLARRGAELSARLKDSLTPSVLLYLYLLSLRDDLSNQNVHLILFVLRHCLPTLKIGQPRRAASPPEREVTEAWRFAQKTARYADVFVTPEPVPRSQQPEQEDSAGPTGDAPQAGQASDSTDALVVHGLSFRRQSHRGGEPRLPEPVDAGPPAPPATERSGTPRQAPAAPPDAGRRPAPSGRKTSAAVVRAAAPAKVSRETRTDRRAPVRETPRPEALVLKEPSQERLARSTRKPV
ncbi:MAG TPA: hypothetical protein VFH83_09580, partial [Spirochaetia bacterium]|nr:hypothetical protein [Spirochaetia bacterium]